ncbi:vanadium-dependent haloperoxidase [Permianibacter sp. IMCC34836]|uniref:vanadium-dependent haloperoxidase n=1 Tax=Permianibacter fluminis TaxID=2738515 RepID=UPI001554DC3B|nr:vanadium-dependent haloperoxidase [Permianibacter fluminis]NQD38862.1 vanadium-dependent haloperoxidase [Permianibacter fluminis]
MLQERPKPHHGRACLHTIVAVLATVLMMPSVNADAVTEWNRKAGQLVLEARLTPPAANRMFAMAHTAIYVASNAISRRYPTAGVVIPATNSASQDAAIAAAGHAVMLRLMPAQQAAIDATYQTTLASISAEAGRDDGVAIGDEAADAVLAQRLDDGANLGELYRPYTVAGTYVPTSLPAALQWPLRKPWLMAHAALFRPGPPPSLTSETWAADFNEVKLYGSKNSTRRSAEQTDIARFWEATLPSVYHGLVQSVANQPGRDVTQNARLFAAVSQAMDDALIAAFDAKYFYNFWRPITAIRNADLDGNNSTDRDASWIPFIETPMHPEYPCAHCVVAAAVATVLKAEIGSGPMPVLTTSSYTANGASRSWPEPDAFMLEVQNARVYDGVHFRSSTKAGTAMGKQIGELAVAKWLRAAR